MDSIVNLSFIEVSDLIDTIDNFPQSYCPSWIMTGRWFNSEGGPPDHSLRRYHQHTRTYKSTYISCSPPTTSRSLFLGFSNTYQEYRRVLSFSALVLMMGFILEGDVLVIDIKGGNRSLLVIVNHI